MTAYAFIIDYYWYLIEWGTEGKEREWQSPGRAPLIINGQIFSPFMAVTPNRNNDVFYLQANSAMTTCPMPPPTTTTASGPTRAIRSTVSHRWNSPTTTWPASHSTTICRICSRITRIMRQWRHSRHRSARCWAPAAVLVICWTRSVDFRRLPPATISSKTPIAHAIIADKSNPH